MTARGSSTIADEPVGTGTSDDYGATAGTQSGGQQNPLAEAGHEAGQSVGMLADRATGIGFQQADKAREQAADGLEQVTESIRRISLDMEGEQPAIANVVTTAADQAERVAEYLRTTDARQMLGTVEDVARRQPLIFLGGAFLLGLAASRLIKAAGGSDVKGSSGGSTKGREGSGNSYQAIGPGGMDVDGMIGDRRIDEGL